jgi:hypothetical protein
MDNKSAIGRGRKKNSSKLNEQYGNVYENKGPLWKTGGKAGMLQKTNALTLLERESC